MTTEKILTGLETAFSTTTALRHSEEQGDEESRFSGVKLQCSNEILRSLRSLRMTFRATAVVVLGRVVRFLSGGRAAMLRARSLHFSEVAHLRVGGSLGERARPAPAE